MALTPKSVRIEGCSFFYAFERNRIVIFRQQVPRKIHPRSQPVTIYNDLSPDSVDLGEFGLHMVGHRVKMNPRKP